MASEVDRAIWEVSGVNVLRHPDVRGKSDGLFLGLKDT